MGYPNRCWNHQIIDGNHPHMVIAAQQLERNNLPLESRVQYSGWFAKMRMGLCPFCDEVLMDEDGFAARYEEWKARQVDVRYCPSCDLHHPDTDEAPNGSHHISNSVNVCSVCQMPLVHPDDVPDGAVEKICEANEELDQSLGYGPKDNEPVIEYDGNEERATYFDVIKEHVPVLEEFDFDLTNGIWVKAAADLPEVQ